MQDPTLPLGQLATHKGLFVAWCGSCCYKNSKTIIWCYRKTESNTYDPKEIWWQAIYVKGMPQNQLRKLVIKYQYDFKSDNGINDEGSSIIIFRRTLIGLFKVIFLLDDIVEIITNEN